MANKIDEILAKLPPDQRSQVENLQKENSQATQGIKLEESTPKTFAQDYKEREGRDLDQNVYGYENAVERAQSRPTQSAQPETPETDKDR